MFTLAYNKEEDALQKTNEPLPKLVE